MIDDGEVAHAESPETYWIPSRAERESLWPGDIAKIRFYIRVASPDGSTLDRGERMWVRVTERIEGWYRGELDNDPHCTDAIRAGLALWFQPRHIIAIYPSASGTA